MLAVLAPAPVLAAEGDPQETITFDRSVYFLEGAPGETIRAPLVIKNSTSLRPTFTSEAVDMESGEGTGSRAFQFRPAGEAPRGAGAWIRPIQPGEVSIPAFEQAELELVVDIPADAGAGGHAGALMFTAPDPRPDSQVRFEVNQPVPIFITVSGEYERDVRVSLEPTDRWRWSGGPATWELTISNEGDVHEPVSGRVRIDGLLGGSSSRRLRPGILFPGETRTQQVGFDLRSAPDLLRADARVDLDESEAERATAASMVVLPIWVLVLVAIAILVIVARIRMRRRRAHDGPDDPDALQRDDWIDAAG